MGTGGTSIAAPEMAGFYAQENAYLLYIQSLVGNTCGATLASPCAPMGNANYYLYDEGLNQRAPHYPFYDVTSGCNNNDITQQYGINAYCAGAGYDLVTGWGSANMFQLAWSINNYLAGDSAGPSIAFSGPLKDHWYNTDQPISWTISDATGKGHLPNGVAGFTYYWDSDPGDPYSEPEGTYTYGYYGYTNSFYNGPQFPNQTSGEASVASLGLGCHNLILRAWDNSGQASVSSYGPVCFDSSPPNTASTLLGSGQYPYYEGPVQVVLTASDYGSGVASTVYQIDNGAWQSYTAPFRIFVPGNHVVSYYSTDIAGNIEATQSTSFTITSNGTFTLTVSTSGSPGGLVSSGDGDIYCGSICSHLYYNGSYVTLTATPPQGSVFAGWIGCDSSSGNICTLSIDSDRQVTAIFNVPTPLQFVSVAPCRVADTRLTNGPFGGPPINGDDYRDYVIPQSPCGIPSTASAYSLNITVVPHGPLGYLTVWPSGLTRPGISTLNSYDGRAKANAAIVPAGATRPSACMSPTRPTSSWTSMATLRRRMAPLLPSIRLHLAACWTHAIRTDIWEGRICKATRNVISRCSRASASAGCQAASLLDELHCCALQPGTSGLLDSVAARQLKAIGLDLEQLDGDSRGQCRDRACWFGRWDRRLCFRRYTTGGGH